MQVMEFMEIIMAGCASLSHEMLQASEYSRRSEIGLEKFHLNSSGAI